MILDIALILLVIICFFIGQKRGFTLEFFGIIKYLLIIFFINSTYPLVGKFLKLSIDNKRSLLEVYIITFLFLYILFTILQKIFSNFLKTIKLNKWDNFLGGILGIVKSTFIIFILYFVVLVGSDYSKKIVTLRNNSMIIKGITEYGYNYTEVFPEFVKDSIKKFRIYRKKEKIKKSLIKEYKETNENKKIKETKNK